MSGREERGRCRWCIQRGCCRHRLCHVRPYGRGLILDNAIVAARDIVGQRGPVEGHVRAVGAKDEKLRSKSRFSYGNGAVSLLFSVLPQHRATKIKMHMAQ